MVISENFCSNSLHCDARSYILISDRKIDCINILEDVCNHQMLNLLVVTQSPMFSGYECITHKNIFMIGSIQVITRTSYKFVVLFKTLNCQSTFTRENRFKEICSEMLFLISSRVWMLLPYLRVWSHGC